MIIKNAPFKFQPFSNKQLKVLTWWLPESPAYHKDTIIADGSVRSGKTISMSLSFIQWSMRCFNGENFGMAGKTIQSFNRNVLKPLKRMLNTLGFNVIEHRQENMIEIIYGHKFNNYYIFGGKDEGSQDLIQGITLAGLFLDEVALMPQSFVSQATARCSIAGARMWFNCNPDGPSHWFKLEYLDRLNDLNVLHLHFTMDDNLALDEQTKDRYKRSYRGVFYKRYILGLWSVAEGTIYGDAWSDDLLFDEADLEPGIRNNKRYRRYIFVDYGIINPTAFLDVIDDGKVWWIVNEWYYGAKEKESQLTNAQLADKLDEFIGDYELRPRYIVIDPSAASFKAELRGRRLHTKLVDDDIVNANNRVIEGIQKVNSALAKKIVRVHRDNCKVLYQELLSYVWDDKAIAKGMGERPIKVKDHGCVRGDTNINTLVGNFKIKDLVGTTGLVHCFDEKKKKGTMAAYNNVCLTQKNADIFEVELTDGTKIVATADHPFLTQRGWVQLIDLTAEDKVIKLEICNRHRIQVQYSSNIVEKRI